MTRPPLARGRPGRQRGAFAVVFGILLLPLLAMIGFAIDLAVVYSRKHELQAVADAAALAAARQLNGTAAGAAAAIASATTLVQSSQYRFLNPDALSWSSAALSFGPSPTGPWTLADAAGAGDPGPLTYARFDTSGLGEAVGKVSVSFLRLVGTVSKPVTAVAVAGRRETLLAPLAICALDAAPVSLRDNLPTGSNPEALEFGFRRGVSYNLLNLNPNGGAPANFLLNPLNFGAPGQASGAFGNGIIGPFLCTGAIPAPPLANGSSVQVQAPFPAALTENLNSRFGQYGGSACNHYSAPPDFNVYDYRGWFGNIANPLGSAAPAAVGGKLLTVADTVGTPAPNAAAYGPLWSFARPLRYVNGGLGTAFTKSDWAKLYPVASGQPPGTAYNGALPPYETKVSAYFTSASPLAGVRGRRVLNVALLQCPVAGAAATMLGIGRFLMTTAATASPPAIHAEFGGTTTYGALGGPAVLYR